MQKPVFWISHVAFKAIRRETLLWSGAFFFLFGVGKVLDLEVFPWLKHWQTPWLNQAMIYLTEGILYLLIILLAGITFYRIWNNKNHKTKLLPALCALFSSLVMGYVLKSFFRIPRPYQILDIVPLVPAPSFSFPSNHAALTFALFIPFWRISRPIGILWAIFGLLIGFARVYEGVHYPSDIAAGIFLGGITGAFFSNPDIQAFIHRKWDQLEFRRQTLHFLTGFLVVFLHWAGLMPLRFLGGILGLGLLISLLSQYKRIPGISYMLQRFDRPRDRVFPGRGAFYFLLGVFLCFLLFNGKNISIAYASILILSVGDSLNHLIAPHLWDHTLPWNTQKRIQGIFFGTIAGTFAAQFFVPLPSAFMASGLSMILESVPFKIGKFYIDDNLVVPLAAGMVLFFLQH